MLMEKARARMRAMAAEQGLPPSVVDKIMSILETQHEGLIEQLYMEGVAALPEQQRDRDKAPGTHAVLRAGARMIAAALFANSLADADKKTQAEFNEMIARVVTGSPRD